jgi:adenine-specific DNA-methyltransferase
MPTLHWIGKEKVINHHMDVPFKVLEHSYGYDNGTQTDQETNSGNKIIHGDNLEALKALLPEYEGRVKCIYIDPPYNTGNECWVYNDNVNDPKIKKWLGQVVGKESEDLSRHDKWLCMMYPRLRLLHKLLADDGTIFISIDDNEQANLKLICDEIFGGGNFVANMIWQKRKGGGNDSFYVAVDHEYLVCYVKDKSYQKEKWRVSYEGDYLKRYKESDADGRFYWDTLSRPGLNNPIIYDVVCPDGSVIKDGTWQVSKTTFDSELEIGNIGFIKNKSGGYTVVRKVRMPEGKVFRSIINDTTNKDAADEMELFLDNKKGFSTPKPTKLIDHVLQLATDKNSIILDSFAGSGTTAHSVLKLNATDNGNRKFILIQVDETDKKGQAVNIAETITAERVKRVIKGYGTTEGTGGSFDFYELGKPLFLEDGNLNELVGVEKIRQYVYYTETKTPLPLTNDDLGLTNETENRKSKIVNPKSYLGKHNDTAYYFHYEQDEVTTLDHAFLATMKTKAEQYVIYADNCLLTKDFMTKHNIIFKKIPRDITRF